MVRAALHRAWRWTILVAVGFPLASLAETPTADQIIQRSVAANEADWRAAPGYSFTEHDATSKRNNPAEQKTYQVIMIDGSPFERLIADDGHPLSKEQDAIEQRRLAHAIRHWSKQAPDRRAKRIEEYEKERHQDHTMMAEMTKAMKYTLSGETTLSGRPVYILDAMPNPDYVPHSRETKVLTGMKGRLWIDKQTYQWAKVEAEVFRPVEFGMFIAKVGPGTRFELDQAPGPDGHWFPMHFSTNVHASVLGLFNENSTDDETYSNYKSNNETLAALARTLPQP